MQPHSRKKDAALVTLGEAKLGEIIVDDEDGDRSFFFEMKVPVERAPCRAIFANGSKTKSSRSNRA